MKDNQILITFKWPTGTNLKNLLPSEINRILVETGAKLNKAAASTVGGATIEGVTFEYVNGEHAVDVGKFAHA